MDNQQPGCCGTTTATNSDIRADVTNRNGKCCDSCDCTPTTEGPQNIECCDSSSPESAKSSDKECCANGKCCETPKTDENKE